MAGPLLQQTYTSHPGCISVALWSTLFYSKPQWQLSQTRDAAAGLDLALHQGTGLDKTLAVRAIASFGMDPAKHLHCATKEFGEPLVAKEIQVSSAFSTLLHVITLSGVP